MEINITRMINIKNKILNLVNQLLENGGFINE